MDLLLFLHIGLVLAQELGVWQTARLWVPKAPMLLGDRLFNARKLRVDRVFVTRGQGLCGASTG